MSLTKKKKKSHWHCLELLAYGYRKHRLTFQFSLVALLCLTLVTPWTASYQASMSITNSQNLLKLMSVKSVMPPTHFILCCPLLLLPSVFPSIRIFSSESVFHIRWPKCWSFSFSISPTNEYSGLISFRFDLVWSPCYPTDSQESSPAPQFKSINSLVLSLLYGPNLTSIHDYWKNHSFDCTDLCQQSNVSAFYLLIY